MKEFYYKGRTYRPGDENVPEEIAHLVNGDKRIASSSSKEGASKQPAPKKAK
jgi:hypothetical protein